jgi:hypothetical protein
VCITADVCALHVSGCAGAVGGVQRRLRGGCAAVAAVGALALASPACLPWLMAASAACATAAATVSSPNPSIPE